MVHPWDDNANAWVDRAAKGKYTKVGQFVGQADVQAALITGALVAGWAAKPCLPAFGSDLARAFAVNLLFTTALKQSVGRERPNQGDTRSFPSGHASSTFALAAVVHERLGWKAGGPAFALASYTAWSRVRDDKHWISDVVAGAALGFAVGRAVARPSRKEPTGRQIASRWIVLPAGMPTGAGVVVVRHWEP